MSTIIRSISLLVGIICAVLLASAACERQEPAAPGPAPAAQTSAAAESQPSNLQVSTAGDTGGADAQDAADAPRALPRTGQLRGWVKVEPVRTAAGGDVPALLDDTDVRTAAGGYRVRSATRCTYELKGTRAEVLLLELASPEDAFGLFSVLARAPVPIVQRDGSIRATGTGPEQQQVLRAWQGHACVQIRTTTDSQPAADPVPLLDRILFNLPGADPPLLVQAIPREKRQASRVWLARSTAGLVNVDDQRLQQMDAGQMDACLGLQPQGEVMLSVAAIQMADDQPRCLIWLTEYPHPAAAGAAHHRLQQALAHPATALDRNTTLEPPLGDYLIGSWTADQEGRQHLLPLLRANLPEPATEPAW